VCTNPCTGIWVKVEAPLVDQIDVQWAPGPPPPPLPDEMTQKSLKSAVTGKTPPSPKSAVKGNASAKKAVTGKTPASPKSAVKGKTPPSPNSAVTGPAEVRKLVQKSPGKLCLKGWGLQSYYSKDYNSCKELCNNNKACYYFALPNGEECDADANINLDDCFLYKKDAEKGACQLGNKACMTTYELSDPSNSSSMVKSPAKDDVKPDLPESPSDKLNNSVSPTPKM